MKYRYFVSWFNKVRIADNGLGMRMDGNIQNGCFEIDRPLNTKDDVDRFTRFLQNRPEHKSYFEVVLLAFSLMYIIDENAGK